ncbi:MAG: DedA family protein, partial [Thermoplasmata archaeon]|nr:DedA family protein [Thermoplasmata archaeon]
ASPPRREVRAVSSIPIIQTVVSVITRILQEAGYPGVFALMSVESNGFPPIPSEVILPFTGFLVAMGVLNFGGGLAAAMAGSLVGSFMAYAVGRWGRDWLTNRAPSRLRLDPRHLALMDQWFARRGEAIVLIARLLPIVRSYVSYPAGTAKMNPTKFGVYTFLGALPFVAVLIYAGYVLGNNWNALVPYFDYANYAAVVAIVVFLVWLFLRWRRDSIDKAPPPVDGPSS